MTKKIVVAITGGSGAPYAVRLVQVLLGAGCDVYLSISASGAIVLKQELGVEISPEDFSERDFRAAFPTDAQALRVHRSSDQTKSETGSLHYCHHANMMAPIASGSFLTDGMVVCPCSGSTLSAIAHSLNSNLIQRAAEVHLKERRKLILVPRETPLSLPQINNMKLATEAGAVILPASPGFYHGATEISHLVDFIVARICDQLGIANSLMKRWGSDDPTFPPAGSFSENRN